MLKHAFKTLIPICIISFIGYLITESIYNGLHIGSETAETVIDNVLIHSCDENSVTHGNDTNESWNISEEYSSISLDIDALDVVLTPAQTQSETQTMFYLSGADSSAEVDTYISGDTLYIDTDSGVFDNFVFIDRLMTAIETGSGWDELFSSSTLTVVVPQKLYDRLDLNLGSGRASVDGIMINETCLNIGSGILVYDGCYGSTENFSLDMGSGRAEVMNIDCGEYYFDIGSGSFSINGLSGSGSFHMGSGSGTLGLSKLNGNLYLNVGSGSLTVGLPRNINAEIYSDIGSGSVKMNACGHDTRLKDGNRLTLGEGEHEINVELNSGTVKFVDNSTIEAVPAVTTAVYTASEAEAAAAELAPVEPVEPVDEMELDEYLEMATSIGE